MQPTLTKPCGNREPHVDRLFETSIRLARVRARTIGVLAALAIAISLCLSSGSALAGPGTLIFTVAGTGTATDTNNGGQATAAAINMPRSIFPTADGGFIFAEPYSNMVRKVGPDGNIATVAGTGIAGFSGDGGPATAAQLNFCHSASPMPGGGFVIADEVNQRIRRVWPDGTITTVAGTGAAGYSGDGGPATSAKINSPRGVAALPDGGFLIPDSSNHRIRRVWPNGTITTVAGTGVQGYNGDGGLATSAQLSIPFGVAPLADGGFLITDNGNFRIRRVWPDGTITTVAGTGVAGFSGDGGPATSAQINGVHNLAVMPDGGFLLTDTQNHRVRRVFPDGTIETIAGTGAPGFSGDGGAATSATLQYPKAVAVTPSGEILIADETNNRIRFVGTPEPPANVSLPTVSGTAQEGSQLTASAGGWSGTGPVVAYQWRRCDTSGGSCTDVAGATSTTYGLTSADVGSTIRVAVTASNGAGSASASSAQTGVIAAQPQAPSNVSPPTISGTVAEGQTLTADHGAWSGATPISYSYQWLRCDSSGGTCAPIGGATAATYPVVTADVGSTLRVRVNASNSVGASDYRTRVVAAAPTSFWRFDDTNSTLRDVRGYANGTYVNGPQLGAGGLLAGDPNAAAAFNGSSQYADVAADPAWTASSFSIEVVVKPSALPVNKTIWATQTSTLRGWWLNTGATGIVRMFVGDGSAWRFDSSGPVLNPSTTYHIVVTWDGTQARLYVNGALVSTGPTATMATAPTAVMRFGANSAGPAQYWPGVIDDASFYPFVLTPSTIAAHADAAAFGSTALSGQTAVVAPGPPVNTGLPVVSGSAIAGQQLSGSNGSWSGTAPITYAYQWQRCDATGAGCVDSRGRPRVRIRSSRPMSA